MRYFILFYKALKANRLAFILFILGCLFLVTGVILLLFFPNYIEILTPEDAYV